MPGWPVCPERQGQADSHAVDRLHRLEKEVDAAKERAKAAAEKAAHVSTEVVNIKGLGRIFKKGGAAADKKDGADEDEDDDDGEDDDADPYASALAAKQKQQETAAYTYDESAR